MTVPEYEIIQADQSWAAKYRYFCQNAYANAYVNVELGISKDLFSKRVFDQPSVVAYFDGLFERDSENKRFLAITETQDIIGGVVAYKESGLTIMKSLYVAPELKGQGLGSVLYNKVAQYAAKDSILVDVVHYMKKTQDTYTRWGFTFDELRPKVQYQIDSWPEDIMKNYYGIYMVKSPSI